VLGIEAVVGILPVLIGGGNIQVINTCRYWMASGIVSSAGC
jgi:hypothetical protein